MSVKIVKGILLVCVSLMLGGCMTPRQVNYLQHGSGVPTYVDTVGFSDYFLQRGDYLNIKITSLTKGDAEIFNGPENFIQNSNTMADAANSRLYLYLVEQDGCIRYPFVGRLSVVGLTLRQVKELLETELVDFLSSYSVDVRLATRTFSVIGESHTGRYALNKEKLTIFEALAMSGDLELYAKRQKIHIIRQTESGTQVKVFDIRSESIINSEFYYIQPNDVIYIPFNNARFVGATNITNVLALSFSTFSFGLLIYSIITKLTAP